jgi:23S rRNA (cytosine1962-C5)-methyltransferase
LDYYDPVMPTVRVKAGHVQPVWAGHPWVYAQAIERIEGGATAGDEVRVVDPRGTLLGRGFYSPASAIPVRILVHDDATKIDGHFFHARLTRAMARRAQLGLPSAETTGYRLVHAEGDGLPGLVVDRLGDALSVQLLTFGMKTREGMVLQALHDVLAPKTILDRTPQNVAKAEGFTIGSLVLRGDAPEELSFRERGFQFRIPMDLGQKTGFYFDQRPLRALVEEIAKGKSVIDAFSYVGPFALAAARGGAKDVLAVDQSALAIEIGARIAGENGLAGRIHWTKQDAAHALKNAAERGGVDLVLADPPRLAPTRGARSGALVAYAKIAEHACRAVVPGGTVVLSSCSSAVDLGSLTRALATGAQRVGRQATVTHRSFQGPDHPVLAAHGEGLYLKTVVAQLEPR